MGITNGWPMGRRNGRNWMVRLASGLVLFGFAAWVGAQQSAELPGIADTSEDELAAQMPDLREQPVELPHLNSFLDGVVMVGMEEDHLPGVVVAIVFQNRLLLAKGWGYADLERNTPVDPNDTLFRIGSVSKTMTFSAVMQLVELGLIDLDADIRQYLGDVPLEDKYGPLTMRHLMTHTPGYEDLYLGHFIARDQSQDYELADYLTRYAPKRVREQGLMTSYSNYGSALAGHIVAEVSGQVFEDYMDQKIFTPLAMDSTTFREYYENPAARHMPKSLADRRARGYYWNNGGFEEIPPYHMHRGMAPAGSVSTTALDMAKWMIAHLNGGSFRGREIMQDSTAQAMHETAFRNAEGMAGNAHGFWANQIDGYATLEHGGAIMGFLSDMVLIPELELGIFVSTNGDNGRDFVVSLPRRLISEFFVSKQRLPDTPPADFLGLAENYEGQYMSNRRGYTTLDKIGAIDGSVATVSTSADGYLLLESGGEVTRWLPLGGHRFASTEDGRIMAFRVDDSGKATQLFGYYGHSSADRVNYLFTDAFLLQICGLCAVCFVLVIIAAWLRRSRTVVQSGGEAFAARFLVLTAVTWLAFMVSFVVDLIAMGGPVPEVLFEFPTQMIEINLWVCIVAAGMTGICLLAVPLVWYAGNWSMMRRVRHTFVVLASVAMVWALWEWRILGFNYL